MTRVPLGRALMPTAVNDPLGVAQHHIGWFEADRLDEIETGDARSARAVADQARRLDIPSGQMHRVDHAGGGDDGCAVLVVVEYRDVHQLAEALLDIEALGSFDVFEVDPAERRSEVFH